MLYFVLFLTASFTFCSIQLYPAFETRSPFVDSRTPTRFIVLKYASLLESSARGGAGA